MLIFGTKLKVWGSGLFAQFSSCAKCGTEARFIEKTGRMYFTIFFVILLFPVGREHKILQCPTCGARYKNG